MKAQVQGGFLSPQNILTRDSSVLSPPFSTTNKSIDGLVSSFVDQATEWRSLTAMMVGGLAYRWGKVGVMSSSLGTRLGHVTAMPLRGFAIAFGLTSEVTAYEFTHRTLHTIEGEHTGSPLQDQSPVTNHPSPNLWSFSGPGGLKEGWLSSLITFATLKGFGKLGETQNLFLQHGLQDIGMVSGHHLLHRFGLGSKPEGTLPEQLVHAEATNLKLGAGTALGHALIGGQILALERSLDLSQPRRFFPENFGSGKIQTRLVFSTLEKMTLPTLWMMTSGGSKTEGDPSSHAPPIVAKREALRKFAEENKIAPDTFLGRHFSKGYKKVAEVEEALEILFGDSRSPVRAIDEIDWIESYHIKGGYGRIRSYLKSPDHGVRIAALRALTALKPPMLIPELSDLLEPYLSHKMDLSMGEVAEIEAIMSALAFFGVPYETLEAKTKPYLRLLVNHPNREVSAAAEAASILLKIISVVPDYRMLLRNQIPEVRLQALSILKAVRPLEYEPYLNERLGDPDPRVRILAAEILTQFGGSNVVHRLGELLNYDEHPQVQFMAARLLGELNSLKALDALFEVVEKPGTPPALQEEILHTLGKLRRWENASLFRQYLTHPHLEVAFAAANGLAQLGITEGIILHFQVALQSPHDHQRRQALSALLALPKKMGATLFGKIEWDPDCSLRNLLKDRSSENRLLAVKLLDRFQPGWDKNMTRSPLP